MDTKENKDLKFNNSNPTAYVIGGAGFVGSYICESLVAVNINVIALDDLSSGKEQFLDKLKTAQNFRFLKVNINDGFETSWPKADYIFHIGGIEAYINGNDLTLNTMLVNSIGTYQSLEFAKKHKSKYLLVSSLDVYNGALSTLDLKKYFGLSERDSRRYTHHEAKRYAEALATEYFQKFDIDVRIVRIAEAYGPRMDLFAGTEIAQLLNDAIFSDTLGVSGDGLKIIHPTFVTDLTAGITKAMFGRNTSGKIYNLATSEEINILNFAYTIQKNSTKPLKIQFTQEFREIKFPVHKIELAQSQNELGWSEKTSLEEGITQTLEYFFLNKDTTKGTQAKQSKPSPKSEEIPYIPPSTPKATVKESPHVEANKAKPDKKERPSHHKVNKANAAILGGSFFVVLLLFIFPLTALFYTSSNSIQAAVDAAQIAQNGSENISEKVASAQKNVSIANTQFDNLEWFFSMLRLRNKFESSRAVLQVVDKFSRSLALLESIDKEAQQNQLNILSGKADGESVQATNKKTNDALLLLEKTILENQAISETIYGQKQLTQLATINTTTQQLLSSVRNSGQISLNVQSYIMPSTNKFFAVVFLDNTYVNTTGGRAYGFALIKAGPKGIEETNFYTTSSQSYASLVEVIKQKAEDNKYGTIEGVLLVNNAVREELVKSLKTVPNEKYAEVITPENLNSKLMAADITDQYRVDAWEAIWDAMKEFKNTPGLNKSLQTVIENEEVQLLVVLDDKSITHPKCNDQNILRAQFTTTGLSDIKNQYCVIPELVSEEPTTTLNWAINTVADLSNQTQKVTLTETIENKKAEKVSAKLLVTLPGNPKVTNLLVPFPVSLEKIKSTNKSNKTTLEYDIELAPSSKTQVTWEWTANISDGNIEDTGIYIEKQYGAPISTIDGELAQSSGKVIKKQAQNRDLIITPSE